MMGVREEILALANDEGFINPREVVAWAEDNPASSLYKSLEWDNTIAADEYRIWQVRRLIKVTIVSDNGEPQAVSLSIDRHEGGGYRRIDEVIKNKSLTEIMLKDALADLNRVKLRYGQIKKLSHVWGEIDNATKRNRAPHEMQADASAYAD